jgi:forespore regulator of the sigma-K checkpoint
VTFSNLYKQLKRRLKMRKRWLTLGAYLLLAGGMAAALLEDGSSQKQPVSKTVLGRAVHEPDSSTELALESIRKAEGKREVFLHTNYVCGEEIRQLGPLAAQEIMSLYKEHPDAKVSVDEAGRVHFAEKVEDLGPQCKENAYFGMDKNGNLTLFEGIPEQERVIRTFFQLDVQHMKSSLPSDAINQLYTGIRVSDLADYNSVLSTFSEYAFEHAEPVTKGSPQ